MADRILVSTQDLINAATEFQNRSNNINNATTEMLTLARGLNSQWEAQRQKALSAGSMSWRMTWQWSRT